MKLYRDEDQTMKVATDWAVRVSIAAVFVVTGLDKFATGVGGAEWVRIFDAIGWGQWFRYATGIIEMVGGLCFLVPPLTIVGFGVLATTMLGAMATWVVILGHPANALFPGVYLLGVVLAFVKLRKQK